MGLVLKDDCSRRMETGSGAPNGSLAFLINFLVMSRF